MWERPNRTAFTIIELLIVLVIMSIIGMVVARGVLDAAENAKLQVLRSDLREMRTGVERYYLDHGGRYPGSIRLGGRLDLVFSSPAFFTMQMTRYTDARGFMSRTNSTVYKYGPYVKGGALPINPFSLTNSVLLDAVEANITVRSSGGARAGWKFYLRTGVLIAADGSHDAE
jgi:prepilin-type N-terminal cleavage/methylation domain-containing protein